ncbi:arrestin domain protein, partial [Cooperia oncophora]
LIISAFVRKKSFIADATFKYGLETLTLESFALTILETRVVKASLRHFPVYARKHSDEKHKRSLRQERVLPAGEHEIPFSYTLPKSLPSSFEGEFGHIRYTCRTKMMIWEP